MKVQITERKNGTREVKQFCTDPSLTKQSFKKECDINNIVKFWKDHAYDMDMMPYSDEIQDVSEVNDFHTQMNTMTALEQAYDNLPKDVQSKFPTIEHFYDYIDQQANYTDVSKFVGQQDNKQPAEPVSDASVPKAAEAPHIQST
jgi:hypothetical protein